jgi:hypothetical protein
MTTTTEPKRRGRSGGASTAAARKAAERARMRLAGLAPLEVWAPKERHAEIKAFAKSLGPVESV